MNQSPINNGHNNLAVSLHGQLFNKTENGRLVDVLSDCERTTDCFLIEDEGQLALSRKGLTAAGDKVSWLAMRQICRLLSAGLAASLSDLLGFRREAEDPDKPPRIQADPDEDFTVGEAASLYNLVLRKRFGRLFGAQAIRNSATNVIEAVVGSRYRRLPNTDFLSAMDSIIPTCDVALSFHSASLAGRRLSITYSMPGHESCDLCPGLRVINSEIGDSAIKACVVLITSTDSTMISPYGKLGRVTHSGRDLMGKMSQLVTGVSSRLTNQGFSVDSIAGKVRQSKDRLLGFKGEEGDDQRFKTLLEFLTDRAGLSYTMAKKCISMALVGDEQQAGSFLFRDKSKSWPAKSVMDLILAIMTESLNQRLLAFNQTDRSERAAWNMFFNKMALPEPDGSGE